MNAIRLLASLTLVASLTAQTLQPTKQHRKLAEQAGVWNAEVVYLDFNTGKPATSKGTSIRKQPLGALWLVDSFQANMMGVPFKGMGTTGYDPIKKKMVGTWIDSMTPSLMVIEGNWDEAGKVLTMSGIGPGEDGEPVKTTLVTTVHSVDEHVFEMFTETPDGEDMKMMTITYTRRTRQMDKVRKQ
jgi:hypothetical protein